VIDHHAETDTSAHVQNRKAIEIARLTVHILGEAQGMRIVHECAVGAQTLAQILTKFLASQEW
jgi:hypothetical protein